jgi:hypothetical protein
VAELIADLVLQARLGVLRSSLSTVERALIDLEDARNANASIGRGDELVRGLVDSIESATGKLRTRVEGEQASLKKDVGEVLRALEDASNVAQASIEEQPIPRLLVLQQTSVGDNLLDDVRERLEELRTIETTLAAVRAAAPDPGEALLREAWDAYALLAVECGKLFGEYVDLVRGVLLRDAGLDHDLCRIADELVRLWGSFKDYTWQAFTIPASRERRDMSSARLIRIGFPEWSVWVLPLTAHEFGHVFAARHDKMPGVVADCVVGDRATPADVRSWVADAFATGVMGPPYVWAMMLLRADPLCAPDRSRMNVMLLMLRKLGEGKPTNYDDVVGVLEGVWAAAERQAGDVAASADVDDLLSHVVEQVALRIPKPFVPTDWERALELVDRLEDAATPIGDLVSDLSLKDLRLVLAAAWHARTRLGSDGPEPGDDHMAWVDRQRDQLASLAERTRLACIELIERAAGQGGGRAGGARAVDTRTSTGDKGDAEAKAVGS